MAAVESGDGVLAEAIPSTRDAFTESRNTRSLGQQLSGPGGQALVIITAAWLTTTVVGSLLSHASAVAAVIVVAIGGALAVSISGRLERKSPSASILLLSAMTAAAVTLHSEPVWIVTALGLAVLLNLLSVTHEKDIDEVHRHIARCRRLQEPADVLVAYAPRRASRHRLGTKWCRSLATTLRLTDTVEVKRGQGALYAVLGGATCDRSSVERRLVEALHRRDDAPPELAVGWARFPDDGYTFDVLAENALQRALDAPPYTIGNDSVGTGVDTGGTAAHSLESEQETEALRFGLASDA